jgi:Zn-dependent protease with chaperone function
VTWTLLLPALVALASAGAVGRCHRRLPPRAATWLLTSLTIGCGLALLWATATVAFGYLAAQPVTENLFGWCSDLTHRHEHVPAVAGVAAASVLGIMAAGVVRSVRRYRRLRTEGGQPLEVVTSAEPIAVTLPGRRPRVLISTGLLACLDPQQRAVVYAHELAHARLRHHRFLLAGDLVVSAIPLLRPLAGRLSHAIERWADEEAATVVGDRRLVATAIARAALVVTAHADGTLAMTAGSVPERVRVLLAPRPRYLVDQAWFSIGCLAVALTVGASSVQLHHLVTLSHHLC